MIDNVNARWLQWLEIQKVHKAGHFQSSIFLDLLSKIKRIHVNSYIQDIMSNTGSRPGSSDALSSLLTDLPGVEGNIFSRPKTLGGMKKVQQAPVKAQTSVNTLETPSSDASFPTSGRPPSYPSPSKPAVYASTPSESHSIADLENMLHGSTPNNAASTRCVEILSFISSFS
jgi:hypothetical protein